ncbi:hypothetical protein C8J56DRAFT_926565 [Mycena floridula]|nr:hypothetical protein C8J56DRAFT_926565 [Mycena floridula]
MTFDEPTVEESTQLQLLGEITTLEASLSLKVLRKHKGDLAKAIDAIFAGDRGEPASSPLKQQIIDLTQDDSELDRAIAISLGDSSSSTAVQFGPSDRPPHENWQLVPTNAQTTLSPEDESLKQAIRASLEDFTSDDDISLEKSVREQGRPIALRAELATNAYAALVIQALFHVPQVRYWASKMQPDPPDSSSPNSSMHKLLEIFTNLDLAQISTLLDSELIPALDVKPQNSSDHPGQLASDLYTQLARLLDDQVRSTAPPRTRLFHYSVGRPKMNHRSTEEGCIVDIEMSHESNLGRNELVSRLSSKLTAHRLTDFRDAIIEPSEVVAFNLKPPHRVLSNPVPEPMTYPRVIYMDQFLASNMDIALAKSHQEKTMNQEIQQLNERKTALVSFKGRDTLKDLEASISYYESLAAGREQPSRAAALDRSLEKLKGTLSDLKEQVLKVDQRISQLQVDVESLFNCPELQLHPYELRAVLLYTGVSGRKNIYSYVQDQGVWWKTVDHTVSEVSEDHVLSDATGLPLGAGPYMLIYSRQLIQEELSTPLTWPTVFTDIVEMHNRQFLSTLPQQVLEKFRPSQNA